MDIIAAIFGERHSIQRPLMFLVTNYPYWKKRMEMFIQSMDLEDTIKKGENIKGENDNFAIKVVKASKGSFDSSSLSLADLYLFKMAFFFSISFLPCHFHTSTPFSLDSHAIEEKNRENQLRKERKERWKAWVVSDSRVIEETSSGSQDSRNIMFSELKVTDPRTRCSSLSIGREEDEDITLLTKKRSKFMRRNYKGRRPPKRGMAKGEHSKGHLICYECRKSEHIKYECPNKKSTSKKFKKKAMVATWSDSDDSQDEEEAVNLDFMALEDFKVCSTYYNSRSCALDGNSYSFDELQDAHDDLVFEFEEKTLKYKNIIS
ncbi:Uncharacterized protein TCM_023839 [Theobroma cacao]|uniref:CCHC-type domain-containing protein n=1 Tax=Theobroma cacao TaxID=3641 RepID=A0A061EWG1_THECC|nr:Uncharacterized protein TCM_023839 [Theobroma cacao]